MPDLSICWCNTDPDLPVAIRYVCNYHREQRLRATLEALSAEEPTQ